MRLGAAGAAKRPYVARRALLQQRHVPLGPSQQARELVQQLAVHLDVAGVALPHPQQP